MPRIYIVLLFTLFFITLNAQNEKVMQAELKQADRLTGEKKYDEALKHIDKVLNIDEFYLEALEKKINILILSDREKEAFKELNNQIANFPQQPEYYYLRAIVFLYKQKPQKAIDDLEDAEYYYLPEKNMSKLLHYKGLAYYYLGDMLSAETSFKKAVNLDPRNASFYHSWGMMKYEEQLYDEAIEYFNKSIMLNGSDPIAYYNIGMAYRKIDDLKNACYNFNRSCNLNNKTACKLYIMECTE